MIVGGISREVRCGWGSSVVPLSTNIHVFALSFLFVPPLAVLSSFMMCPLQWKTSRSLPSQRIIGCCFTALFKDQLIVATTVARDDDSPCVALFSSGSALSEWKTLTAPPIDGAHTIDGLCAEQIRGQLYAVIRPLGGSAPCEVWALHAEYEELDSSAAWSHFVQVPNGHRCGAFQICGPFFVAAGGRTCDSAALGQKAVDAYDLWAGSWAAWPELPFALFASAAVSIGGQRFVLVGGVQGTNLPEDGVASTHVLAIDIRAGRPAEEWTLMAFLDEPCLAPSAATYHNELIMFSCLPKTRNGAIRWWDKAGARWRGLPGPPVTRVDVALTMFGGRLVCVGGLRRKDEKSSLETDRHCACGLVHELKLLW